MFDSTLIIAFFAAAVPSFFTPGPNNLMLMTSSARFGIGRTVPHMIGVCLGFPLMVLVIGLGLGEVFTQFPALKTILKYGAAIYLLWMAWTLLGLKIGATDGGTRPLRVHESVLFQWINPKAWAMAVSFVALVVAPGANRLLSLGLLTLGCLLLAPFSSFLWMAFGRQLENILRRTQAERLLGLVLAGLMILAVVLFLL